MARCLSASAFSVYPFIRSSIATRLLDLLLSLRGETGIMDNLWSETANNFVLQNVTECTHNVPECMQVHELACSYISLYDVT